MVLESKGAQGKWPQVPTTTGANDGEQTFGTIYSAAGTVLGPYLACLVDFLQLPFDAGITLSLFHVSAYKKALALQSHLKM